MVVQQDDYALALAYLRLLAQQRFGELWRAGGVGRLTRSEVRDAFAELTVAFGEQAAAAAVDYLVLSRSLDEELAGLAFPDQADPVKYGHALASYDWALNTSMNAGVFDAVGARVKLDGILARVVSAQASGTIVRNVMRDGTAFARVPEPGACSFCLMLASRGAVYTAKTVGAVNKFHDHCRCLGVEVKRDGSDLPRINRDLEQLWSDSESSTQADFEKALRARKLNGGPLWPELKTVTVPAYKGDGMSTVFPGEPLPKDLDRVVAHVLFGWRDTPKRGDAWVKHSEDSRMGHTWDTQREGASKFPKSWSNQDIANAVVETLENPEKTKIAGNKRLVFSQAEDGWVMAEYTVIDGSVRKGAVTAYMVDKLPKKGVRDVD